MSVVPIHRRRLDRRDWLREVGAVGIAAALGSRGRAAQVEDAGDRFFPGFKRSQVQTSGATINVVSAGSGPPVLLLHGAPQTHVSWRLVAPNLAKDYTVVAADLRGYGDSSKPPDEDNHAAYSKRAMALDQVEVMRHFGFDRFAVVGHDRGGRVGHRLALDHPERVTRLAVLDIVPTQYLYTHVTIEFVQAYFHWFNYLRPVPGPENQLKQEYDAQLARGTSDVQKEYLRTFTDPATIHAMCEDYRAGASIDLKHDEADLHRKIACPLLVLWGARAPMGRIYDILSIWKERAERASGRSLPAGHNLQEEAPDQVLAELQAFLK